MLQVAESIARTDTGRHRSGNEDSAFVSSPVFVLADGMGGAQAGEVASRLAIEQFMRGLPERGSAAERLVAVAQRANAEIYRSSVSEDRNAGMGTTLVAAYVEGDAVTIAHVGDSRAYMLRGGELRRLTEDHSLVGELVRGGRLTEEQARVHPQRSVITRALGIEKLVKVDTWSYPLSDGDVVLLCSDGLTDMIAEAEVQQAMVANESLEAMADTLIDAANRAGGRDNITVVLFRIRVGEGQSVSDQDTRVWRLGADFEGPPAAGEAAASLAGGSASVDPTQTVPNGVASDSESGEVEQGGPPAPSSPTFAGAELEQGGEVSAPGPSAADAIVSARRAADSAPRRAAERERRHRARRQTVNNRRHRRLWTATRALGRVVAVALIVAALGAGAYVVSRQYYFVSTNANGVVVVDRGVPYTLPFGVKLYQAYYESGAPAQAIPAARRATILNQSLRSRASALALVHDVELGEITG